MLVEASLERIAQRVRDYVFNREEWHADIVRAHGVSTEQAKRLPNRLMNGGGYTYTSWLSDNSLPAESSKLPKCVQLQQQMRNVRPLFFQHPLHKDYATKERIRIVEKGEKKTEDEVDRAVFSSLLTRTEAKMLATAVAAFRKCGWVARALIHDGFVGEPEGTASKSLCDALTSAENDCHAITVLQFVKLTEKPLHGLQCEVPKSIVDARAAVSRCSALLQ